ncbi:FAD-dependent oxidoreductase [Microbacterium sp. EST19A]|uniref:FAD-dependent oxidoreductase n=1 Tax=Microbacterium sp. EST19A TaxID=2862681 RepID=UPI001CBB12C7|nr:FAD-dependent oxidoreductase [Microbacterium sp. EST19A]
MNDTASTPHEIIVVGAGMVAHRFVESLLSRADADVRVTVIGDEGRGPYDRAALTSFFSGTAADELELDRSVFADARVRLISNDRVLRIDRSRRAVRTRSRRRYDYDTLVLATGSYAPRVAVEGADVSGCFVYRTLEDAEQLQEFVARRRRILGRRLRGAVIGGGLLGLELAGALQGMDVDTTVAEHSDRLMPAQLDPAGGRMLKSVAEARGLTVRTQARTVTIDPDESGAVTAVEFQDGSFLRVDVVVFTVGVRPRDELARNAGLDVHPRGGVLIDEGCTTSDPRILAVGEVANFDGRCVGSVAPGYAMAEVAATRLLGGQASFPGYDESAALRLPGVEVASFGDAHGRTPGAFDVVHSDPGAGIYRKLVLSADAQTLLGAILVGDASEYGALRPLVGAKLGADPSAYLLAPGDHVVETLQNDGTYTVIPSVPGGRVTPDALIAIGQIAKDFGLQPSIVDGHRIDLRGARLEQLPRIRQRLVDAGLERCDTPIVPAPTTTSLGSVSIERHPLRERA